MLDILDPSGKPGLTKDVLAEIAKLRNNKVKGNPYFRAYMAAVRDWNKMAGDSRAAAMTIAERTLLWPKSKAHHMGPPRPKAAVITKTIRDVLATQPAIVEGSK